MKFLRDQRMHDIQPQTGAAAPSLGCKKRLENSMEIFPLDPFSIIMIEDLQGLVGLRDVNRNASGMGLLESMLE